MLGYVLISAQVCGVKHVFVVGKFLVGDAQVSRGVKHVFVVEKKSSCELTKALDKQNNVVAGEIVSRSIEVFV